VVKGDTGKRDCPEEIKPQNKISIFNYNHSNADNIVSSELINLNQDELNVPLSPNIGANDYIISIIENGYKLPLFKTDHRKHFSR